MTLVSPLDAPALLILGVLVALIHRRWLAKHNEDWFVVLGAITVSIFWLTLFVAIATGSKPLGIIPAVKTDSILLGVFYPLAYPFWFWLGGWAVFLLFGRRPEQGGIYWLYRINDRTEDFDSAWDS